MNKKISLVILLMLFYNTATQPIFRHLKKISKLLKKPQTLTSHKNTTHFCCKKIKTNSGIFIYPVKKPYNEATHYIYSKKSPETFILEVNKKSNFKVTYAENHFFKIALDLQNLVNQENCARSIAKHIINDPSFKHHMTKNTPIPFFVNINEQKFKDKAHQYIQTIMDEDEYRKTDQKLINFMVQTLYNLKQATQFYLLDEIFNETSTQSSSRELGQKDLNRKRNQDFQKKL